jgi:hypothetical protein
MAPNAYWGNGHYYEYVDVRYWSGDAKNAADSRTWQGLTGYLATVTSQGENDFIHDRSNNNFSTIGSDSYLAGFWYNANNGANRKNWRWIDGPREWNNFLFQWSTVIRSIQ